MCTVNHVPLTRNQAPFFRRKRPKRCQLTSSGRCPQPRNNFGHSLVCTFSSSTLSFLRRGKQKWTQLCSWGLILNLHNSTDTQPAGAQVFIVTVLATPPCGSHSPHKLPAGGRAPALHAWGVLGPVGWKGKGQAAIPSPSAVSLLERAWLRLEAPGACSSNRGARRANPRPTSLGSPKPRTEHVRYSDAITGLKGEGSAQSPVRFAPTSAEAGLGLHLLVSRSRLRLAPRRGPHDLLDQNQSFALSAMRPAPSPAERSTQSKLRLRHLAIRVPSGASLGCPAGGWSGCRRAWSPRAPQSLGRLQPSRLRVAQTDGQLEPAAGTSQTTGGACPGASVPAASPWGRASSASATAGW